MESSRIEIIDRGEFVPREWLRREVLWASLVAPYGAQLSSWLNENANQQHNSNVSRRDLFGLTPTPEYQAQSFFNQGKNVASITSAAVLFRACMTDRGEGSYVDILNLQAATIDKVMQEAEAATDEIIDTDVYKACKRLAELAFMHATDDGIRVKPGSKSPLLRASRLMCSLASFEASTWLTNARQNEEQSLPLLEVQNGGHPRSAGPHIEMLQTIFRQIVVSKPYRQLELTSPLA